MKPTISVVMASRNGERTIAEAVRSVLAQDCQQPWELIFADNGSTDSARSIFAGLARENPKRRLRRIDASARAGKGYALNLGIAAAEGALLLFIDDDDTVAPGWMRRMAAALEGEDLVAARIDSQALNPAWAQASRQHAQQRGLRRLRFAPYCLNAGGATLGMRRRVFERVGGFDETLRCLEDTDFCIRAHLAGFEIAFAPEAIYHYRFRTEPDAMRRQAYDYARHAGLLRRRYDGAGSRFAPLAWFALGLRWGQLRAARATRVLLMRPPSAAQNAQYHRSLGKLEGEAAGALAHGLAPRPIGLAPVKAAFRAARTRSLAPWFGSTVAARPREKLMALTFDDGPDPASTPLVLDALAQIGAKATFFVLGARAERRPDLVARILAEGHEIGNHSWDHPSLPRLEPDAVQAQLARTRALLAPDGQALMRPPYGDQTLETHRIARRLGYRVVLWSVSGEDWLDHPAEVIASRIVEGATPGAIVLLHDALRTYEHARYRDRAPTIAALGLLAARLPDYRFVTVSHLLDRGAAVQRAQTKRTPQSRLAALADDDGDAPAAAAEPARLRGAA